MESEEKRFISSSDTVLEREIKESCAQVIHH